MDEAMVYQEFTPRAFDNGRKYDNELVLASPGTNGSNREKNEEKREIGLSPLGDTQKRAKREKLTVVAQKRRTEPLSASECSASASDDLTLEQLPTECLSRVLSFVNCPKDLETASVASEAIASLVEEDHLWRSLTLANFDMNQVSAVHFGRAGWRNEPPATMKDCNWRRAYLRLLKRYGDQHFYTAKLAVCEVCFCLFWPGPQGECTVIHQGPEEPSNVIDKAFRHGLLICSLLDTSLARFCR
ncbi:uncharacterized protein DEA37_0010582 [Paragonimus westermani]|uniref:F-box domain-containing protein n=1 Tax=Paragonimus westermani TaxID=34504 RepID=A0A5J4NH40_9TREM|nr:uncharacterized protein DEA37_0010582 [Paragonimus westermani]